MLCITDDSFDSCITEFIEQDGVYDMSNRLYDTIGICPTLLADSGSKLFLVRLVHIKEVEKDVWRKVD